MFSQRLRALREQAGMTQCAFARSFGVAQSTAAGWESGAREPNLATICRLADYFGVTVDYLLAASSRNWTNGWRPCTKTQSWGFSLTAPCGCGRKT